MVAESPHRVSRSLLAVAFLAAGAVALWGSWWEVDANVAGSPESHHVKPFHDDGMEGVGGAVVVTGILTVTSLAALIFYVVAESLGARAGYRHLFIAVATLLGLAAVLYAVFGWPGETDVDGMRFWGKTTSKTQLGSVPITIVYQAGAGWGWFVTLLSNVLGPGFVGLWGMKPTEANPRPK